MIPVNGPLDGDLVAEALSSVKIPGRIEQIRTSPTIILDGGHNVNAAEALRKAIEESYDFKQLVGVVAMMRDKQVEEYLGVLEPILSSVVVTENSWRERVMPADELEKIAVDVFGRDRVIKEANLPDAIQTARQYGRCRGRAGHGLRPRRAYLRQLRHRRRRTPDA